MFVYRVYTLREQSRKRRLKKKAGEGRRSLRINFNGKELEREVSREELRSKWKKKKKRKKGNRNLCLDREKFFQATLTFCLRAKRTAVTKPWKPEGREVEIIETIISFVLQKSSSLLSCGEQVKQGIWKVGDKTLVGELLSKLEKNHLEEEGTISSKQPVLWRASQTHRLFYPLFIYHPTYRGRVAWPSSTDFFVRTRVQREVVAVGSIWHLEKPFPGIVLSPLPATSRFQWHRYVPKIERVAKIHHHCLETEGSNRSIVAA